MIQDIRHNLSGFKGFNNDCRTGKKGSRKAHLGPLAKIVIQDFQMMAFHLQMRLGRHGMGKLIDGFAQAQPSDARNQVHAPGRQRHEAKVLVDQGGDAGVPNLDCHQLITEDGLVHLGNGPRSQGCLVKVCKDTVECALGQS